MSERRAAHDETRRRILDAARAHVLSDGHQNFSLRAVAKRAGFSPASLYEYFEGRDEIVAALATQARSSLKAALERTASRALGDAALVAIGEAYVRWAIARREDFLLLFTLLLSSRQPFEQGAPSASPYTIVLGAIARAAAAGAVSVQRDRTIEQMAYGLWAAARHGHAAADPRGHVQIRLSRSRSRGIPVSRRRMAILTSRRRTQLFRGVQRWISMRSTQALSMPPANDKIVAAASQ